MSGPANASPYLVVEDVAELLRCSVRTVHELTRSNRVPHRRIAGTRRCLFLEHELRAWIEDAPELEVVQRRDGSRIVRPRGQAGRAAS